MIRFVKCFENGIVRDYDLSLLLKEKVENIEEKPKAKKSRKNGF